MRAFALILGSMMINLNLILLPETIDYLAVRRGPSFFLPVAAHCRAHLFEDRDVSGCPLADAYDVPSEARAQRFRPRADRQLHCRRSECRAEDAGQLGFGSQTKVST